MAMGFAIGNYACSLVHRLPRGRLLLDKPPYCGHCGTLLATKDLFPVFSALLLRHRCRYCGTPFPVSHTWTELLIGILFTLAFLKYGYGEQYFLLIITGVFLVVLAAIHVNDHKIMNSVLYSAALSGLMYRILVDHTIYNAFEGGLYMLLLGTALHARHIKKEGHVYILPPPAKLLAVGGLCVGASLLPQFLFLYAGLFTIGWVYGVLRRRTVVYPVAFGFAVMLTILYPGFILQ